MNNAITNLTEELRVRSSLNEAFDKIVSDLTGGLSASSSEDVNTLVLLLVETIEARKSAEKQEKALKGEVRRHIPEGEFLLNVESGVVIVDRVERGDLDKEAILRDFGQTFIDKYTKRTSYEKMTVRAK